MSNETIEYGINPSGVLESLTVSSRNPFDIDNSTIGDVSFGTSSGGGFSSFFDAFKDIDPTSALILLGIPAVVSALSGSGAVPTTPGTTTPGTTTPGDTSNQPGNTSNQPGDTSNQPGDTSNQPGNTSNQPGNTSNQSGDTSNQSGDTNNQSGDTNNQSGDTNNQSGDTNNQSGDTNNQSGDTNNQSGDTKSPNPAEDELINAAKTAGISAATIDALLKYGLPALASYLSYKDAENAREEARGWSAPGGYAKQAVRSPGGGVTFKPAGKAAGGIASLAGGGIASLADGGIASLAGGGNILDEEIKTYITNVLGNKKSQQEQAAEINAAAQKYNIGRDRIAQATGYGLDAVKQFLGPNIIGQKTAAAPYQVYDKASDTYRYVDAAGYEKWLSGIPLTPTNRVQGSPVYYGAPSKAEGDYGIGGGSLDYVPSMSEEPDETLSLPRYDMYGNQLEDDPNLKTMTEAETEEFEKQLALDPESRARLLEPLRNAFMPTNAVGDLDVQQMLRNIYNNPETRELFYEYTNQLKDAPYDAAEWFQKYNELVQRSEGEGFTPDREYMPLEGVGLARINRENRYLPRNIANEMFRLVAPNTPDTVIKNYGDVKGNLPEDYVVTDRGQAIEPNQGLNVNDLYYGDLYYGAPLSEMGVTGVGGGKRGGVVHRPHYATGGMTTKQPFYLGGITDGMADEVPAHIDNKRPAALSDGEFVIPADVVSHLGNGNSNAGAKRLYEMMDRIREARTGNSKQGIQVNPNNFMPG